VETFGETLRRLRTEAGMSQPALAAAAHYSQTRISRAENGFVVPPPDVVRHLDRVLCAQGALISLREAAASERPTARRTIRDSSVSATVGEVDDTDRRDVLRAVAIGFGAMISEPPARIIASADEPRVLSRIGADDLSWLEQNTATLEAWDRQVGGATTRHALLGALRGAVSLKGASCTPSIRLRLTTAIAYLADLAAWAVGDAGLHGPATGIFTLGIETAREANDPAMLTHVASGFARLEIDAGNPHSALDLIRLAQSAMDVHNPLSSSMLHALRAMAYA
jgi:transcriptional regulator with XRE-family HTH domain